MAAPVTSWLRRLPLTLEGLFWALMALGMIITGLVKVINLITLLACFILAMIGWNFILARRQLRLAEARQLDGDLPFAGTPWSWQVVVRNTSTRPVRSLRVQLGDDDQLRTFIPELRGAESTVAQTRVTFRRRGPVALGAFRLVSGYPLGLVQVAQELTEPRELLVLPRLGILNRRLLRSLLHTPGADEAMAPGRARFHAAAQLVFHGLRVYRPGDSPRLIHWRTSARLGEPMVREFEDPPENELTLVVDACRPAPLDATTEDPAFERLLSLAATICWEYCRQRGDSFRLVVAGASVRSVGGITGPHLARELLEALALEPGATKLDEAATARALSDQPLPAGPILVLALACGALARGLRPGARRGVVALDVSSATAHDLFEL